MSNNSIWPIDRTLSGATTLGQSESESDGNEGVFCISQSSSFNAASLSDNLVSYPGHLLEEFYPSLEMQLVYSTAPPNWAEKMKLVCWNWLRYSPFNKICSSLSGEVDNTSSPFYGQSILTSNFASCLSWPFFLSSLQLIAYSLVFISCVCLRAYFYATKFAYDVGLVSTYSAH